FRALKQRLPQRSKVKSGAADENGNLAARFDLSDLCRRTPCPIRRRIIYLGRNVTDKMVRHAAHFFDSGFCRRDLDLLVNLDRITVDNLTSDAQRKLDTES